jgi:hypothetical protein
MLCPACSAVISDTAKVCGYCGTRIATAPLAEPPKESAPDEPPHEPAAPFVEPTRGTPVQAPPVRLLPEQPKESAADEAPATPAAPVVEPAGDQAVEATAVAPDLTGAASSPGRRPRRWVWVLGGLLVVAAVAVVSAYLIVRSGNRDLTPSPASTAAGQPPFVGGWQAVDAEGDVLFLWIVPTGDQDGYRIVSHDEGSRMCQPRSPALVDANGTAVSPNAVLQTSGTFLCLYPEGARRLDAGDQGAGIQYRYLSDTDSLVDSLLNLTWLRVNTEMSAVFDPSLLSSG